MCELILDIAGGGIIRIFYPSYPDGCVVVGGLWPSTLHTEKDEVPRLATEYSSPATQSPAGPLRIPSQRGEAI